MAAQLAVLDSGDIDLDTVIETDSARVLAISLGVALRTIRGEYAADLRAGLDGALIFGSLAWLNQAEAEILRVARSVPGVRSAEISERTYDRASRRWSYTVRVNRGSASEVSIPLTPSA